MSGEGRDAFCLRYCGYPDNGQTARWGRQFTLTRPAVGDWQYVNLNPQRLTGGSHQRRAEEPAKSGGRYSIVDGL